MRLLVVVTVCIFIAAFSLSVCPVQADEVYLKNGDLITGEVGTSEDGKLIVETSYAKKIKVKWDEVVCVTSDKEVTLLLKNKEKLVGRVMCADLGSIKLVDNATGEATEFSLADLVAINPPPPPPPVTYRALVDVGGSSNKGNTRNKNFNSSGKFQARSEWHRLFLEGKFNYGESEGDENKRNWLTGAKYDYFLTKKIYTYLRPLAEYDKFQDLDLRYIIAAGPGYQFVDTERTALFGELGIAYINEDYGDEKDNSYASGRWSVGAKFDIVRDKVKFFHLQEGYYDLSADEGLYLRTEQGLRLPIVENFYFNFQVNWQYKSEPPDGNKSSDTAFILGIGYELNF